LYNKDSSVIRANNHARKIWRDIESLICNLFITIEEAVLVPRKVVFRYKLVQIQNTIRVSSWLTIALFWLSHNIYIVQMHWNFLSLIMILKKMIYRPADHPCNLLFGILNKSIQNTLLALKIVVYALAKVRFQYT
jgi:hypothetical protein